MADSATQFELGANDIPASLDLLSRLKIATELEHRALENDLALLDKTLDLVDYRALLGRFYGFYQPWEIAYLPFVEQNLPGATIGRSKVHLVSADLRDLGGDPAEYPVASVQPPNSLAQALGAMYVIEGSTLGGQLISRHLTKSLGLTTIRGRRFFFSYGEQVGAMWRNFRTLLLSQAGSGFDEIAIDSASQTFTSLRYWLCTTAC